MRVAIVHDWLNGMRGGEKVLEIISGMFPDAPIYTLVCERDKLSVTLRSRTIHPSFLQKLPCSPKRYRAYLPLFPSAIEGFDLREYDLILSASHCVAKGAIPGPYGRHLCYCFTPMRYIWDGYWEYFRPGTGVGFRRFLAPWVSERLRTWDASSCARVDRFVAISHLVAARIRRYYGRESAVIHPPVDTDSFALNEKSREDFLLAVSALVPYKRLDLAIQFAQSVRVPLKIVGQGPEWPRLKRLAEGGPVEFLGRVSFEVLRDLYRRCRAFVMPGEEDFGIAPVEAQACGAPVIALARGGALETVIQERSGLLFPEPSQEALKETWNLFQGIRWDPATIRESSLRYSTDRFVSRLRECISDLMRQAERDSRPTGGKSDS